MKKIFFVVLVLVIGYSAFTVFDVPDLLAGEWVDEHKIDELVADDIIVLHEGEVLNLSLFHSFYTGLNRNQDEGIRIVIDPYTRREETHQLRHVDDEFVLHYGITTCEQGNTTYETRRYDSMARIFRNNEISFILENETSTTTILSYRLN